MATPPTSFKLPVSAEVLDFGSPIWFIQDADGKHLARVCPASDETTCRELVVIINASATHGHR